MAQKRFDFSTLRGCERATEARAFQCGGGGSEPQCAGYALLLSNRQRERAVEYVASAERIHRMHRERRCFPKLVTLVKPESALRAARARQKRRRQLGIFLSASASLATPAVDCSASLENTR